MKTPKGMDPAIYAQMMGFERPQPTRVVKVPVPVAQQQAPTAPPPQEAAVHMAPQRSFTDIVLDWIRAGGPFGSGAAGTQHGA
jgi:hypothetical protein